MSAGRERRRLTATLARERLAATACLALLVTLARAAPAATTPARAAPGDAESSEATARAVASDAADRDAEPPEVLVRADATWRFLRGREPYPEGWREPGFDDATWDEGPAGFGYGDGDDATLLEDMQGSYLSLALRHEFRAKRPRRDAWLELAVDFDDGFVAWLNGEEIARVGLPGEPGTAPAHDATARHHEAGDWSAFEVPRRLLRQGRNVLAVQVNNASRHSSDLTFRAELRGRRLEPPDDVLETLEGDDEPRPPEPVPAASAEQGWAVSHALTLGSGFVSNYFQARAGSPKERVLSGLLGYRLDVERTTVGGSRLRLRTEIETERFEGLGTARVLDVRFERRRSATRLDLRARLKLDRPAFRIDGDLVRSDTLLAGAAWTWRPGRLASWEVAGDWIEETNDRDPDRENEQLSLASAVRFLPDRALSPELGLERGRLRARAGAFDYDQWRVRLQLIGRPARSTYLSLLLRWTDRDYATENPADGNFGRNDRRLLARALVAWRPTRRLGLVGWASWEDGDSSRRGRAFEGLVTQAAVTLHF